MVTRRRLLEWVTADRRRAGRRVGLDVARRCGRRRRIAVAIACDGRRRRARPLLLALPDPRPVVHLAGARLRDRAGRCRIAQRARQTRSAPRCARSRAGRGGSSRSWSAPPITGWSRTTIRRTARTSIAHRTSPTNIGLQLLSTLAAYDFGYISYVGLLDRLEPTFDTLLRMQRYRGHFYNWYDTRTLAPLRRPTSPLSTAATSPAIC